MRSILPIAWGVVLGITACGQRQPTAAVPSVPPAATLPVSIPKPPAQLTASQLYGIFTAAADTTLQVSGRTYRLSWQVHLDTLQPRTHITLPDPATYFPGDTSRGFQGYYKFEVSDSLGHRVGAHTFTKADFYPAVGPELAISSEVELPHLLGYSEPLGGLVFTVTFNAPGTDWYGQAVLILTLSGQVRYLGLGAESDGPEITVALASNGQTLLTKKEIKRAGQVPIPLRRMGAELRGATLLNDTLALLIYEPGILRTSPSEMPYVEATATQLRQPNAFVLDVRSNQEISHFRYDGFQYVIGYIIPMQLVPQTQAVYLTDDDKGLYVLPLRKPATGRWLSLASMHGTSSPPTANEVSLHLSVPGVTESSQERRFLVDTVHATRVRIQLLKK